MNAILEGMTGMDKMNDQVIAADFSIAVKSGIKSYAIAISETASPEVRNVLKKQLNDAINMQEKITNYMMTNGYYHPYDPVEQFKMDMKATDAALSLGK